MVPTPERSRAGVLEALRSGCSTPPQAGIHDVQVDGEGVSVRCSPARSVTVRSGRWDGCGVRANEWEINWRGRVSERSADGSITSAHFELRSSTAGVASRSSRLTAGGPGAAVTRGSAGLAERRAIRGDKRYKLPCRSWRHRENAAREANADLRAGRTRSLTSVTDALPRAALSPDRLDVQVSSSVGDVDVVAFRKRLTAVTKASREVAWRGPARFAARIEEELSELRELVAARHPGCVSLCRSTRSCASTRRSISVQHRSGHERLREACATSTSRPPCRPPPKPRRSVRAWSSSRRSTQRELDPGRPERSAILGDNGLAALDGVA